MLQEFKDFAMKGNVIDLAFGVIIGGAFGKIVDSLVKDVIMPIIGMFGNADFNNYFIGLSKAVTATNLGVDTLNYFILSGNTSNTFALDNNGLLTVANATTLNYETLALKTQFAVQFEMFVNMKTARALGIKIPQSIMLQATKVIE